MGGHRYIATAEGNGPVNALDKALRIAIGRFYPRLDEISLEDYKVRVLDEKKGTGAITRVLIESGDGERAGAPSASRRTSSRPRGRRSSTRSTTASRSAGDAGSRVVPPRRPAPAAAAPVRTASPTTQAGNEPLTMETSPRHDPLEWIRERGMRVVRLLHEGDCRYGLADDDSITLISDEPFSAWEPEGVVPLSTRTCCARSRPPRSCASA